MHAQRFGALDLLRLVAALAVLLFHWSFTFPSRSGAPMEVRLSGAQYGWLGVELFFLISGFVILMSASESTAGRFVRLRAIRLYPGFWICCTLTALVTNSFSGWLANLTMVPAWLGVRPIDDVYWTLLVELQFYGLVAIVLALRQLHRVELLLWAWLVVTWLPGGAALQAYGAFFIGGAACYLVSTGRRPYALLLAAWASCIASALAVVPEVNHAFARAQLSPWIVGALVSLFFAAMLLVATRRVDVKPSPTALALGGLTYPLYLLHDQIGLRLFRYLELPPWLAFACALFAILGLSWYVYRLERPIMRWLRGL